MAISDISAIEKSLDAPTGVIPERIQVSTAVLEFVSQYVDLKPTPVLESACVPSTTTITEASASTAQATTGTALLVAVGDR